MKDRPSRNLHRLYRPRLWMTILGVCVTLIIGLAAGLSRTVASDPTDVRWRWPGIPHHPCMDRPPAVELAAYAEGDRCRDGLARMWTCLPDDGPGAPDRIVTARLRFAKSMALLPDIAVEIDHFRWDWQVASETEQSDANRELAHVIAFSRGNGACRTLFDGECRLEFFRDETDGERVLTTLNLEGQTREAPGVKARGDDVWSPSDVTAAQVVNFYTGTVWTVEPGPSDVSDSIAGRPARRFHQKSLARGFPLFTSWWARVTWFDPSGEILRICDHQVDFGISHTTEFVRTDKGIAPEFDCERWF